MNTPLNDVTETPWGSYAVLHEDERYKVKLLVIKPGARTSLQTHLHRMERMTIVRGAAELHSPPNLPCEYYEGDDFNISVGEDHRIVNPGKIPLEIIEVQIGSYLGEDDIVRLEDDYGRAPK